MTKMKYLVKKKNIEYNAIIYAYVPPEKEEENADMTESPDTKMVVNEEEKEIREEEEINEEKEIKKEIDLFPFEKGEGLFNKLKNDGINFTKHYNKKYNVDEIYFNNNDNEKKSKKKLRPENIIIKNIMLMKYILIIVFNYL